MDQTLTYAGRTCDRRWSKLAMVALGVGAMLVPAVWVAGCYLQDRVDFGDSVTQGQALGWALLGAAPGILGTVLPMVALSRVRKGDGGRRGVGMALAGLGFSTFAALLGAFCMMVISLQNS